MTVYFVAQKCLDFMVKSGWFLGVLFFLFFLPFAGFLVILGLFFRWDMVPTLNLRDIALNQLPNLVVDIYLCLCYRL